MFVASAPRRLFLPCDCSSVPGLRWLIWGLVSCCAVSYTPLPLWYQLWQNRRQELSLSCPGDSPCPSASCWGLSVGIPFSQRVSLLALRATRLVTVASPLNGRALHVGLVTISLVASDPSSLLKLSSIPFALARLLLLSVSRCLEDPP